MRESEKQLILKKAKEDFIFKLGNMRITPDSIILVLQYAMEIVELTTLTGPEKKTAVIDLIRNAVVDAPMNDHIESILLEMIDDGILSHIIDVIVSAARGKLHLSAAMSASTIAYSSIAPHTVSCLAKCFPCIKAPAPEPLPIDQ
tara:strand:- start:236 stop:670 length:435 start_codon:yes stop_codon:yes gene_type:complete